MSEDELQEGENIELKHTYSEKYELHPVTGVTGGSQPQGQIKFDFVYDHDYKTKNELYDPDTGVMSGITIDSHMEREHMVGITMEAGVAQGIAIYMLNESTSEDVTQEEIISALRDIEQDTEEK